ncbi:MAG: hypothetical protein HC787_08265 [Nostocaceae cyanobacterium CSU_2_110]|nr:hypothetical protein [Nostocaceae cyanobacterium CSU_2_110]
MGKIKCPPGAFIQTIPYNWGAFIIATNFKISVDDLFWSCCCRWCLATASSSSNGSVNGSVLSQFPTNGGVSLMLLWLRNQLEDI